MKQIAGVIAKDLDSAKIIVLLRNPTARLYSFFNHRKKSGQIKWDLNFESHVAKSIADYQAMPADTSNRSLLDKCDRGLVQGIYND